MARDKTRTGVQEAAAQRRLAAFEYRKCGLPLRAIAQKLGVSAMQIGRDIASVMEQINAETLNEARELRTLQYERLELALVSIAPKVARGDLGAIDRWISIIQAENVLMGLNAPTKIAPTDPSGDGTWVPFKERKTANLSYEQLCQLEELMMIMEQGQPVDHVEAQSTITAVPTALPEPV